VTYVGPEAAFAKTPVQIRCGRRNDRYNAKVLPASP
jgi:hypothetical protein